MDEQDKIEAAVEKKAQFLNQGLAFIRDLKPRFVVPFAGQYTLCGKLSVLDDYRGIPTLHAAASYFHRASHDRTLVMDAGDWIDLQGSVATEGSRCGSMAEERRRAYRDTVLAKRALDYENDALPTQAELEDLARAAFARFDRRRRAMGIEIMRPLYIAMLDGYDAHLRTDGELTITRNGKAYQHYAPYVRLTVDPRLLVKLLKGPSHAHWNRAEIGSHITFERVPDVYDRGLYRALHHFYA
jgi:UDP-MurNAc hydroxylase